MALVARRAGHGVGAHAGSRLTGIALRTGITVVTGRVVRLRWIRAHARRRIAGTGYVTLIARRARDRIRADAGSRLTRVALRTSIAVVT